MKKVTKSKFFWVLIGIIVGVAITYSIMSVSVKQMAPGVNPYKERVLIASTFNPLTVSTTDRFTYEPSENFPVSERFAIAMEHKDHGMLIENLPSTSIQAEVRL